MQPAAQLWVDTVADVRVHGATQRRPVDMFEEERAHLKPLNPVGLDLARVRTASVNKQFRVALDANTYSVNSLAIGQHLCVEPVHGLRQDVKLGQPVSVVAVDRLGPVAARGDVVDRAGELDAQRAGQET